jgi:hypothetical protein
VELNKKSGMFDVRSFYSALRNSNPVAFPWKSVWRTKAPRRACFFVWTAAWNKILTCDNLRKRGYTLPSWCCMCVVVVRQQTICFFTALWRLLYGVGYFTAFGVQWVMSGTVVSLLSSWWNGLGRHSSAIWNMVPICLMWTIWKERNQHTFEDVYHLDCQILESFTSTLFEWSRTWGCTSSSSLMEFSSSLYLISHDVNSLKC